MQRPASITIFGILNFAFAAFGVVGLIGSFALFSVPTDSSESVIQLMHQGPAYATWLKICIPLELLSCAGLVAGGFGLLCLKPWGRVLAIACAIYNIVFCATSLLMNLILMAQPFFQVVGRKQQLEAAGAIGGPISGTVGELFWLIYPIVLLIVMLHPKVTAAFKTAPPQTQIQFSPPDGSPQSV